MSAGALFDVAPEVRSWDCVVGPYRYRLSREWAPELGRACFVMLNPSKAKKDETDPTDTRVHNFTRDWGYGAYDIVNLHAFMATDPDALVTAPDPFGPDNAWHIGEAIAGATITVAAWGASFPKAHAARVARAAASLRAGGAHVLGLTKDGHPRHPLYMRGDTKPQLWSFL